MRIAVTITMFLFWLVLSGHYETWLIAVGFACSFAVAMFWGYMGVGDREGHPVIILPRAAVYWVWLAKEMVLSAIAVARIIVHPRLPVSPTLVRVHASERTPVGLTTYANSITLTPGTISVEISSRRREILVHGITRATTLGLADGAMDRRVRWVEAWRR